MNWEHSKKINYGKWINSTEFDTFTDDIFKELFTDEPKILGQRQGKKSTKRLLKVVLINLYIAYLQDPDLCIAISLDKNKYSKETLSYPKVHAKYEAAVRVFLKLKKFDYIMLKKGFNDERTGVSRSPKICWTSKFEIAFEYLNLNLHDFSTERKEIVLRDSEGVEVEFKSTTSIGRLTKQVVRINDMLRSLKLELPLNVNQKQDLILRKCPIDFSRNHLSRIFKPDFKSCGRLFGGWYQNVPKEYRPWILINGNPTAELDYSNLHPRMLYAREGVEFQGDIYNIPRWDIGYRPIIKKLLNTGINARTEEKIIQSLFDTTKMSEKIKIIFLNLGWLRPEFEDGKMKLKQDRTDARNLLEDIKQKHQSIKQYFGSGMGVKLQREESDMAVRIMLNLWKKGIGTLCLHDSFVVERQYQQELLNEMMNVFYQKFKVCPEIDQKY